MPLDPNAIPSLIRALDSEDAYVRITAAEALGKIGHAVAIDRLAETYDDPRPDVRRRVIRALERIGTEPKAHAAAQVVPCLAQGLDDSEPLIRWAAESALKRLDISSARAVLAARAARP
jgi:HEAT repeat protein